MTNISHSDKIQKIVAKSDQKPFFLGDNMISRRLFRPFIFMALICSLSLPAFSADDDSNLSLPTIPEGKITLGDNVGCESNIMNYGSLNNLTKKIVTRIVEKSSNCTNIIIAEEPTASKEMSMYFGMWNRLLSTVNCIDIALSRFRSVPHEIESDAESILQKLRNIDADKPNKISNATSEDKLATALAIGNLAKIYPWLKLASLTKGDVEYKNVGSRDPDTRSFITLLTRELIPLKTIIRPDLFPRESRIEKLFFSVDHPALTSAEPTGYSGLVMRARETIEGPAKMVNLFDSEFKRLERLVKAVADGENNPLIARALVIRNAYFNSMKELATLVTQYDGMKSEAYSKEMAPIWQFDNCFSGLDDHTVILFVKCVAQSGTNKTWRPVLSKPKLTTSSSVVVRFCLFDHNGKALDSDVLTDYQRFRSVNKKDLLQ